MLIRKLSTTEVGKTTIFDNYSVPSPRPAIRALWDGPLGKVFTVHVDPTVLSPTSDGVTISFPDITDTQLSSSHTTKKCPSANSHPKSEVQCKALYAITIVFRRAQYTKRTKAVVNVYTCAYSSEKQTSHVHGHSLGSRPFPCPFVRVMDNIDAYYNNEKH